MTGFYQSPEWRKLRKQVKGDKCLRCGSRDNIQIDHIKPRSLFPELALKLSNLQPLCGPCNKWKGTRTIDFRPTLMGKIKKALSVIAIVALSGFILTHQVIRDPLLELAKPHIAESLGLLTADLCEATVMP